MCGFYEGPLTFPQSRDRHSWGVGDSKMTSDVNVSVSGCLFLYVKPCEDMVTWDL